MNQFSNHLDWEVIIETIRDGKCILFLGPELYNNEKGESLEEQMAAYLSTEEDEDICRYNDGLYFFRLHHKRTWAYYKIKEFYQRDFPLAENLFEKIAQLPFHFIISITPDKKLGSVFERLSLKYKSDFYWKKHPPSTPPLLPSQTIPLIYSILGSVEQQESMVLTHNDLFDYFESIFQGKSMPEQLRLEIQEANNFIFLGLRFDKWYMQLLLRILYLHTNEELLKYASNFNLDKEIQTFYYDQFRINFVNDEIDQFVETLHEKCREKEMIRQPMAGGIETEIERIREFISDDKLDIAFELLHHFIESHSKYANSFKDEVTALKGRYENLRKKIAYGTIDTERSTTEMNNIRQSLIEFTSRVSIFE